MPKVKKAEETPILVAVEDVVGAHYNPRVTIEERLEYVCLSLSYLGFVLPLYRNKQGILLSGHQRTKAAIQVGYTHVPVVDVDIPASEEKGINLVFNQATNDMAGGSTSNEDIFKKFLENSTGQLPEGDPTSINKFPCMETKTIRLADWIDHVPPPTSFTRKIAKRLVINKIYMPLVICGDRILNGVSRFYSLIDRGFTHAQAVEIPEELADFAFYTLNLLSMDFNLQENFKDELRYNAFRRSSAGGYEGFSRTYSYFVFGRTVRNSAGEEKLRDREHPDLQLLPHKDPKVKKQYLKVYGDRIIDFGAGTLHDAKLAQKGGLNVYPFEPYHLLDGKGMPSATLSKQRGLDFLNQIKSWGLKGIKATSVISSYTMNSIPHHKDRMAVLCILSALCGLKTTCFLGTQHVGSLASRSMDGGFINPNLEPNMNLGSDTRAFKAQKYFQIDELEKMLKVFWVKVEMFKAENTIYGKCRCPRKVKPELLRESLELEFNLPFPGGKTLDLVNEAIEAFSTYTHTEL